MLNLTPRYTGNLPTDLPEPLKPVYDQSPTLARLFLARGIVDARELSRELTHLLSADGLLGIDTACVLLDTALDEGKRVLIVGDFDCDGATSTALMMRVLTDMGKASGAKVNSIVPDRFKYGYGLTPEIVELGIKTHQPDLIVTVDNGISSHAGVDFAKSQGVQVIITDHHLTTKATPNADAVVNPNQLGCDFGSKSLVGVGVAFYLLGRLAKLRREAGKSTVQVSRYLDLVALGTVADVGQLDHNNRILVHHGLEAIRAGRCCVGITALLEQAGRDPSKITASDFGFVIAPRINAAGRMDSMDVGIKCLTTDNRGEAEQLAFELDKLNQDRRRVEGEMRRQADQIVERLSTYSEEETKDRRSLVLYQDDWHQGVIGIVAGRLKETHHVPAIVFAPADTAKVDDNDAIKGSARSIAGIHIRDAIEQVANEYPELISHFGGHAMAAGLTLPKRNLTEFRKAFDAVMTEVDAQVFTEEKFTDGQLLPADFSLKFIKTLNEASVWGHGFVPPQFDGVFNVLNARILKDKHLKLQLTHHGVQYPIEAIWFNYDSEAWDYRADKVHVLYELSINEWNGSQSLQLMIKDLAVVEIS